MRPLLFPLSWLVWLFARIGDGIVRGDAKRQRIFRKLLLITALLIVGFGAICLCVESKIPIDALSVLYSDAVKTILFCSLLLIPCLIWRSSGAIIWSYNPFKNRLSIHENRLYSTRNLKCMVDALKSNLPSFKTAGYSSISASSHFLGRMDELHLRRYAVRKFGAEASITVAKKKGIFVALSHFLLFIDGVTVRNQEDGVITLYLQEFKL